MLPLPPPQPCLDKRGSWQVPRKCWEGLTHFAAQSFLPNHAPYPSPASFPNTEDPLGVLTPEDDGWLRSPLAHCPSPKMAAMSCQHPAGTHKMAAPRCCSAQQRASSPQRWLPSPCRAAKRHVRVWAASWRRAGWDVGCEEQRKPCARWGGGGREGGQVQEDVREGLSRCGGECWVTLADGYPCGRNQYL